MPSKRTAQKSIKPDPGGTEFGKGSAKSKPCPKDVVAGGFSQKPINPGGGLESSALHVHSSRVGGERWKASATQGGLAASKLRSIALCG